MPLEAIGKPLDRMEVNLSLFHTTVGKGRSFVKRLFFTLYAAMFHLFRVFPVQKKRVALISMHNADFHDSLGEVERAFREKKEGYFFTKITRRDRLFYPEGLWPGSVALYFSQ